MVKKSHVAREKYYYRGMKRLGPKPPEMEEEGRVKSYKDIPLVGDWAGRPAGRPRRGDLPFELIRKEYPMESEEGIMGLPTWAVLLGAVLLVGGLYYYKLRQTQPAA